MVGLYSSELMADAMRAIMARLFTRLQQKEADVRRGEDAEAVHDMRVATRRLRTAMRVATPFFRRGTFTPFTADVKRLADRLGAVRDLEVLQIDLAAYRKKHEKQSRTYDLAELADYWHSSEETARLSLRKYLDGRKYAKFLKDFTAFFELDALPTVTPQPGMLLRVSEVLPMEIWRAYGGMRSYEPHLVQPKVEDLHGLRIAGKRFRYLLEFFREVLPAPVEEIITVVVGIQDHLGALNDAQVACAVIEAYLHDREHADGTFQPLKGVSSYLADRHQRMSDLMAEAPSAWNSLGNPLFRRQLGQMAAGV